MEFFNKSVNELSIIEKNVDLLVNTNEPPMHSEMKKLLEDIKKDEGLLVSDYDGGTILIEEVGKSEYKLTKFKSKDLGSPVGSKTIKFNQLVKMFEQATYLSPK